MQAVLNIANRIALIVALGIASGALASLAAVGFVELVAVLNEWFLISPRSRFMVDDERLLLLATICVPAAGGLVVALIHRTIPGRRSHGPPDIMGFRAERNGKVSYGPIFVDAPIVCRGVDIECPCDCRD